MERELNSGEIERKRDSISTKFRRIDINTMSGNFQGITEGSKFHITQMIYISHGRDVLYFTC